MERIIIKQDRKPHIRIPNAPPSQEFKDKKKYSRKVKHKKNWGK